MFRKETAVSANNLSSHSIETIIGEGAVFEGTITTKTALRVDGAVKGNINSVGTVIIGESGEVTGVINSKELYIAGTINGDVDVVEKLEIVSGGHLFGDLVTGSLVIENGAVLIGNCKTKNSDKKIAPKAIEAATAPAINAKTESNA